MACFLVFIWRALMPAQRQGEISQAKGQIISRKVRESPFAPMPLGNPLASIGGLCPEGTFENSPVPRWRDWVLRLSHPKSRRDGRKPARRARAPLERTQAVATSRDYL